jgi:hypothetical protein
MSNGEILAKVASGELTVQEAGVLLTANRPAAATTFRVSEKGAVSVYGMGRFPVTLYAEQWERLLSQGDELRAFIAANKSGLKVKPVAKSA